MKNGGGDLIKGQRPVRGNDLNSAEGRQNLKSAISHTNKKAKEMIPPKLFENQPIRSAWDEGEEEWYFSVVDIVGVLTEQPDTK
ncbi:MAG: hypothetical protein Q4C24_02890, partial [Candidatus Saccharibacteria bacterium]|nr:hypothetical protein [Candidatus Saccharibacteria bacterium]